MNVMEHAVIVNGVTKSYGQVEALRSVSFTVPQGELFGIIGPDGAGKTSLFRIRTTLLLSVTGLPPSAAWMWCGIIRKSVVVWVTCPDVSPSIKT